MCLTCFTSRPITRSKTPGDVWRGNGIGKATQKVFRAGHSQTTVRRASSFNSVIPCCGRWASSRSFRCIWSLAGFGFFLKSRYWEHAAQTRERDNARLRADVARVDELAQLVTHMKAGEQQLRSVLASHINLPPTPYEARSAAVATLLERPSAGRDRHWRPAIWPISPAVGWMMRGFESAEGIVQSGIDIAAAAGTAVRATADGQVKFAGADPALGPSVGYRSRWDLYDSIRQQSRVARRRRRTGSAGAIHRAGGQFRARCGSPFTLRGARIGAGTRSARFSAGGMKRRREG